jgi:hypothetical protein
MAAIGAELPIWLGAAGGSSCSILLKNSPDATLRPANCPLVVIQIDISSFRPQHALGLSITPPPAWHLPVGYSDHPIAR